MSTPSPAQNPDKEQKADPPKAAANPAPDAPRKEADPNDKDKSGKLGLKISPTQAKAIGVLVVIVIAMWGLFRACTGTNVHEMRYVIARDDTWYPSQLMGREKNMDGFTDVLIPAIAKINDLHFSLVSVGSSRLIPDLKKGYYEGILTGMPPTSTNRDVYLFSEPFYLYGPVLIVPINSKVTSIKEMEGKIVAVKPGSFSVLTNVEKYPSIMLKEYDNITAAFTDMENGNIDGIILPALEAYSYAQSLYAGIVKVATPPLTDDGLRLATLKSAVNESLIKYFNEGLKKLEENGEYDKLLKDWGLIDTEAVLTPYFTPEAMPKTSPNPAGQEQGREKK